MKDMQIIIFAGFSAAGKSTLSEALSATTGMSLIKHQDMVHQMAKDRGFERTRHWISKIGVPQFVEESENELLNRINNMEGKTKGVIFDVLYREEMVRKLKTRFPESKVLIISVLPEPEVRGERIRGRMGNATSEEASTEMKFRDNVLREAGLNELLLNNSDLIINNMGNLETSLSTILNKIESL